MPKPPDTNPQPRSPAPQHDPVFIWPTPSKADYLFYVEKNGDLPKNKDFTYGDAYWDAVRYPNHKLVFVSPQTNEKWSRWFYASDRINEDAYNWEFSKADLGGTKFDAVRRTYLTPRSGFDVSTPATGATMPDVPAGKFTGTYVLAGRETRRSSDETFDSLYVIEIRTYVKKVTQAENKFDSDLGGNLRTVQTLYYGTEIVTGATTAAALFADGDNAYWELQSGGHVFEGEQLTADWYVITDRQVVPTDFANNGRTYTTAENYYWPAVLDSVTPYELDIWPRNAGGDDMYVRPLYSKEAYRGPCKAVVLETFHVTAPTPSEPNVMMPLPIDVSTPFFSLNVGPCLHDTLSFSITSGTSHPIYDYAGGTYSYPATSPIDWPASILAVDEVRPFRGGFLRTRVTVYPPDYTAPP